MGTEKKEEMIMGMPYCLIGGENREREKPKGKHIGP